MGIQMRTLFSVDGHSSERLCVVQVYYWVYSSLVHQMLLLRGLAQNSGIIALDPDNARLTMLVLLCRQKR